MADPREEHEEELQVADLSSSDVVTKYRTAAEIVNKTLQGVIAQCVNGADVYTICQFASTVIDGQCAGMFKSKKIAKGVAFPPAISVNNTVCHFSPLKEESIALKAGDMIKIDLGAHIDGFIATAAHSMVVPAEDGSVADITGPAADVVVAAYNAAQIAARLIKPGAKNTDVTKAIERVAEAYEVEPMSGTLSHNLKQFVIDGAKVIAQKDEKEARVAEEEFEVNEVYGVDICFTTGEGKPRDTGVRTTIYKRAVETQYMLKMKSSRYVLSEVNKRFPTLPFNIGVLEDQKQARVGIVECLKHELLHPYQVLSEVEGAHVAHFKFTVLLMETGNTIITGAELPAYFKSDKSLPADLATVAKSSLKKNNRRKKKKAAAAGGGASA